ncbi:MAG: sigma-70 family RNA polymerase sigma factor [Phycisphaeraceae bacterium]|nr:MAG: sigma-70 family RNA polymerase sigma factor [Phycisphaeraceae bacterium]
MTPNEDMLGELLDRAQAGEREALIELLEAAAPRVRARIGPKISPHLRSSIDEDDVMQVTYLEVVTRFDTFHGGGSSGFIAWMARLAENNLIDAIRMLEAEKRPNPRNRVGAQAVAGEESTYALIDLIGVTVTTPSKAAVAGEIREALNNVLAKLPPDYATVIRLYDLKGKPASEVAAELGRSEGAIYMLRARAHDRLRELLPGESRFFSVGG